MILIYPYFGNVNSQILHVFNLVKNNYNLYEKRFLITRYKRDFYYIIFYII